MVDETGSTDDFYRDLPRRPHYVATTTKAAPMQMEKVVFKVSPLRVLSRLGRWAAVLVSYWLAIGLDHVRGKRGEAARAVRLREAFERAGGTFVKIGQQLSTRADLLPFVYCTELGKMLDRVPPFPVEQAIERIEESTGAPMQETFSAFDRVPIGSASVACVYQGLLHDGRRVAVKVRRPGIGRLFAADLTALDWLLGLVEWLTIVRPGLTRYLRHDLAAMLLEELDFRKEARYQFLFRRYAKKHKQKYVSAPKPYHKLSNTRVLVQEFVSGIWLSELLAAVESEDRVMLARYAEMGITPKKVSKRILETSYWSTQECPIFHADPHPANIVVQKNSKLIFIDFGACGPTPVKARRGTAEMYRCLQADDIAGAVRAAATVVEPLPRIDIEVFASRAEEAWREVYYATRYKHAPWWERTSAALWLSFLGVVREFNLPLSMDSLRTMRASLLYDTLAARLWDKALPYTSFLKYQKKRKKRLGKKLHKKALNLNPTHVVRDALFRADEMGDLGARLLFKLNRFADLNPKIFFALASKASYVFASTLSFITQVGMLTGVAVAVTAALGDAGSFALNNVLEILRQLVREPLYHLVVGLALWKYLRRIHFRLSDMDDNDATV